MDPLALLSDDDEDVAADTPGSPDEPLAKRAKFGLAALQRAGFAADDSEAAVVSFQSSFAALEKVTEATSTRDAHYLMVRLPPPEPDAKDKFAKEEPDRTIFRRNGKKHDTYMGAYAETQPVNILDYSVDQNDGDRKMHLAMNGDFCRKCGQKMCRCVDYSQWGGVNSLANQRRRRLQDKCPR